MCCATVDRVIRHHNDVKTSGQFTNKGSSTSDYSGGGVTMEEGQLKMKMRIAQLDDWITEGKAFVADADKKIKELGDVFRMMMVSGSSVTVLD